MLSALSHCILKIEHGVNTTNRPEDRVLGERWLAYLASVLATAETSSATINQMDGFDRLVGSSFLIDPKPFGTFYDDWREYRNQNERFIISGMTGNERLLVLGLIDTFDHLVTKKQWEELRLLLRRAHFDEMNIEAIILQQQQKS